MLALGRATLLNFLMARSKWVKAELFSRIQQDTDFGLKVNNSQE
jgi:hypothetical protein